MASGTDGSLNFDTEIDKSGFEKGVISLKKLMDNIVQSITKAGNSIASSMGQQTTSKVVDLTGKIKQTEAAIDQLKQKMETLATTDVNASMIQKLNQQIEKAEQNMISLLNQREQLEMDYQLPGLTAEAQQRVYAQSTEWQRLTMQIDQAEQVLSGYERKLAEVKMMSAGTDATQSQEYQNAQIKLQGLTNRLNVYKTKLQETQGAQNKTSGSSSRMSGALNKVKKSSDKTSKSMKKTQKSTSGLAKSLKFTLRMLGMTLMFRAFSAVINGAKEGFENLAKYSDGFNHSMSSLMSAMTRLKNSFTTAFAPIVTAVEPTLRKFIDLISEGVSKVGQFVAALLGQKTFTKAKDVQEDYAKSLEDSNKSAKKLKGTLASFDKAEVLNFEEETDNGKADPKDMFEEIQIDSKVLEAAKKFKELIEKLKTALGPTIEALGRLKEALEPLKKFVFTALYDFYDRFLLPVGKWVLGNGLPRLINLIADTLTEINWGNLNGALRGFFDQLARAAVFVGDAVIDFYEYALKPIFVWTMGEGLPAFINALSNGLARIDFERIRQSLINLWKAIAPFAIKVGEGLLWFFDKVLVPLAAWVISDVLPLFLDALAALLKLLSSVIDALEPGATWLFENFLEPLAEWTGEVIIQALKKIVDGLTKFSDWINRNQSIVEGMTAAVLIFFAAWKFSQFVVGVQKFIGAAKNLITILSGVNLQFVAIVAVIGTIAFLAIQVARAWDKMTPGEQLATKLIALAGAIALVVAAIAAFMHDYATMAIAGAIAAVAGISIYGIASNANARVGGSGGSFARSASYAALPYSVPALATGAVIPPNAPFMAVLGDQRHGTNIEAPLSTIEQALDNVLSRRGGSGKTEVSIKFVGDLAGLARLLKPEIDKESSRIGVSLVTTGGAV